MCDMQIMNINPKYFTCTCIFEFYGFYFVLMLYLVFEMCI